MLQWQVLLQSDTTADDSEKATEDTPGTEHVAMAVVPTSLCCLCPPPSQLGNPPLPLHLPGSHSIIAVYVTATMHTVSATPGKP